MPVNKIVIGNIFRFVLSRTVFFYLVIFIVMSQLVDIEKVWTTSRLKTLNRIMPELGELIALNQTGALPERSLIDEYAFYYQKTAEYVPFKLEKAQALAILGYCQYRLDRKDAAIRSFKEAAQIRPEFFWFHYNLGIIYFNEGQWASASESFEKALALQPEVTVKMMYSSKIYQQILVVSQLKTDVLLEQLKSSYELAQKYFIMSQYLQRNQVAAPEELRQGLNLRLF